MKRKACRTDIDCSDQQRCGWDSYCESGAREPNAHSDEEQEEEELEAAIRNVRQRYGKTASSNTTRATR